MGDFVHKTLHMLIFIQLEFEILITEISSRRFLSNFLVYKAKFYTNYKGTSYRGQNFLEWQIFKRLFNIKFWPFSIVIDHNYPDDPNIFYKNFVSHEKVTIANKEWKKKLFSERDHFDFLMDMITIPHSVPINPQQLGNLIILFDLIIFSIFFLNIFVRNFIRIWNIRQKNRRYWLRSPDPKNNFFFLESSIFGQ